MDWPATAVVERIEPAWDGPAPVVSGVFANAADRNAPSALPSNARFISRGASGSFALLPVGVAPTSCCEPQSQIVIEITGARLGLFRPAGVRRVLDDAAGPSAAAAASGRLDPEPRRHEGDGAGLSVGNVGVPITSNWSSGP